MPELLAHLDEWYRRPTDQRIATVTSQLRQVRPPFVRRPTYSRISSLLTFLRVALDERLRLEARVLHLVVTDAGPGASTCATEDPHLVLQHGLRGIEEEQGRVLRILQAMSNAVDEMAGGPLPVDEAVLLADLEMLSLLLHQRFELEERCLWPRVAAVVGQSGGPVQHRLRHDTTPQSQSAGTLPCIRCGAADAEPVVRTTRWTYFACTRCGDAWREQLPEPGDPLTRPPKHPW